MFGPKATHCEAVVIRSISVAHVSPAKPIEQLQLKSFAFGLDWHTAEFWHGNAAQALYWQEPSSKFALGLKFIAVNVVHPGMISM
jgi:hypothetical protein